MAHHTYIVQPGDSLSLIAQKLFGDMMRWEEIYNANKDKISDPNVIEVGMELIIPGEGDGGMAQKSARLKERESE